jgi:hypothetical protein
MRRDARQQRLCADQGCATRWISGLRGWPQARNSARKRYFRAFVFWRVLAGPIEHTRLANRTIDWLRHLSPIWLAQDTPQIRVLMNYPG